MKLSIGTSSLVRTIRRRKARLLDAMEHLLTQMPVSDITVEAIVTAAHTSVGAFYKRFSSREDLLPLVLERLQKASHAALQAELSSPRWQHSGLADRIDGLIDAVAAAHQRNRPVIRACISERFQSQAMMTPANLADAQAAMQKMREWLLECRSEIRHENPELAIRLGLYFCLQSLQTALLFEVMPEAISPAMVTTEAKQLLRRYLGVDPWQARDSRQR